MYGRSVLVVVLILVWGSPKNQTWVEKLAVWLSNQFSSLRCITMCRAHCFLLFHVHIAESYHIVYLSTVLVSEMIWYPQFKWYHWSVQFRYPFFSLCRRRLGRRGKLWATTSPFRPGCGMRRTGPGLVAGRFRLWQIVLFGSFSCYWFVWLFDHVNVLWVFCLFWLCS